jgi:hypothetical protein
MPKESKMNVNATGDYAETAKRQKAPMRAGALDQMSNGSMDYLSKQDGKFDKDVKKIRRTKCDY